MASRGSIWRVSTGQVQPSAFCARDVDLQGSVGRGGRNAPEDMAEVRTRLLGLCHAGHRLGLRA